MRIRPRRIIALFLLALLGTTLCGALVFGLMLMAGARTLTAAPAQNSIVYGLSVMPGGFDPYINDSTDMGIVLRSVYDTLIYRDPTTRQFVPGLAAQTQVASDGLTYTFQLRRDVTFHDGTPFNAQAVAHTLDRITNPDTHSQRAVVLLGPYDHYTIVDQYTIQIVLKQPYAPLLDALCQFNLGIASPKALDAYDNDRYQFHQIGTGPFMMTEYIPGDHITLRRNLAYKWGPSFYRIPTAHAVDEIVLRFFRDPSTRAQALETGDAQIMGQLLPTDAALLAGNSSIRLYPQTLPGLPLQFLFNTHQPPTNSLEIRQGLIRATNRAAIVDAVFQQFSPVAFGALSATTPFYDKTAQSLYGFDAAKALQLLATQGYGLSTGDKTLSRNGKPLHLVMVVPPWDFHPEVAQRIQSQWAEIGVELELRQVANYAALLTAQKAGDYNLIALNDFGLDPDLLTRFYGTNNLPNWTGYQDTELDGWLNQAEATVDAAKRTDFYAKAQQRIMGQALVLPIRDPVNLNGASARVGGLSFDAYGWYPLLANLTLDAGH